ncbi:MULTISPECIES: hypothetical protein [unclassified Nocardioides]|uniref:hypothetical protein n=1 Tax=unclassified Nocardioides TaxID=2615069 RepID=UPI0009F05F94|nr:MULTISPECIES: hypothetical protein [unclassified Nocardioides]GAW50075.1 uncharacterized protein PD653B2_2406 [Nocardioides sp. PD653-B2]GAW57370.1 uncharacterized protein PD653_4814 [Nocardioides sp. PD653]
MTWKSFHSRGEILRDVIAVANRRRDGALPLDVDGVADVFDDDLTLLGDLQLRWHTRLAGRIERELLQQPMDLEKAVVAAWHATADELPGVLAILDRYRADRHGAPLDQATADAMATSTAKERILLAMMAGRVSVADDRAVRVGAEIERRARASYQPQRSVTHRGEQTRLLDRIKAALAA